MRIVLTLIAFHNPKKRELFKHEYRVECIETYILISGELKISSGKISKYKYHS